MLVLKQELDERGKGPDAAAYAWHICTFALGLGALLTPSRVPPAEAASALRAALRHDDDGRCAREIDATLLDGLVLCLDTYPARTPPAPARQLVDARA